jgi:hypothetical protein
MDDPRTSARITWNSVYRILVIVENPLLNGVSPDNGIAAAVAYFADHDASISRIEFCRTITGDYRRWHPNKLLKIAPVRDDEPATIFWTIFI